MTNPRTSLSTKSHRSHVTGRIRQERGRGVAAREEAEYGAADGGIAQNSVEGLKPGIFGWAGLVYEHISGEESTRSSKR